MNKNIKRIIKGVIGLGVVGGVAFLSYKLGESDGRCSEIHRRLSEMRDEDDNDFDFDEPDDGCISPQKDYKLSESDKFDTEGYGIDCANGDHIFTRLRNIDSEGISTKDVMRAAFFIMDSDHISNKELREKLDISLPDAEHLLNIFEAAGYVSARDDRYNRKVFINDVTIDDLL